MKALSFSTPFPKMLTTDDQRELDGLRQLNPQVISAVYDRYFPQVYRYVRYRISDDSQAEDTSSDVFVRLLEAVRAGRPPESNLKAWLLATASHAVNDHLRLAYRRPTGELPEALPDSAPQPVDDVERRERQLYVRKALTGLNDEQQHVLALRFGEGLSLEETATVMRKNINAVKQLQFRALAALNRKVGEIL